MNQIRIRPIMIKLEQSVAIGRYAIDLPKIGVTPEGT